MDDLKGSCIWKAELSGLNGSLLIITSTNSFSLAATKAAKTINTLIKEDLYVSGTKVQSLHLVGTIDA